jgi:hypothetical protein
MMTVAERGWRLSVKGNGLQKAVSFFCIYPMPEPNRLHVTSTMPSKSILFPHTQSWSFFAPSTGLITGLQPYSFSAAVPCFAEYSPADPNHSRH